MSYALLDTDKAAGQLVRLPAEFVDVVERNFIALAMLKKAKAKMGIKNKRLQAGRGDKSLEHIVEDSLHMAR